MVYFLRQLENFVHEIIYYIKFVIIFMNRLLLNIAIL